ncbi:PREDICTED: beta-1,3-glucan-binding protein-like [Amphimedon queenslandica]|uniref:GH16 domain-containing protein n=1 Tax=Amphimedon queenslandica TaxID=400682 RepID=A0A1X7UBF7_AMPQE|nr:PREDICTED: beta-1,3-glucan-binding protein-like [Amphimedon queenslandica]|eukprot:XP_003388466.2 PREDICTED: beta-1,3-glucan-binding protein-like [Amphimedon queenslandica]
MDIKCMSCYYFLFLLLVTTSNGRELTLALEDEFDTFNLSLWKHEITLTGGGNWEFEAYLNNRSNSFVRDGVLYIKPTLLEDQIGLANVENGFTMDIWGGAPADLCTQNAFFGCLRKSEKYTGGSILNPIKSARLRTAESFNFKYGKIEVKAKLPIGDWLWPAIWMLPRHNQYGVWPSSGEIDIMESRGNAIGYSEGGYDSFGSTLHWGIDYMYNFFPQTHKSVTIGTTLANDFHVYGLIWNETYIGTYFDDESNVVLSVPINQSFWSRTGLSTTYWDNPWVGAGNNAPFDQEYYLIMNVAVGGTTGFFPDGPHKPWNNTSPTSVNQFYDAKSSWYPTWDGDKSALKIDSVRVWTYSDGATNSPGSGGAKETVSPFLVSLFLILALYATATVM